MSIPTILWASFSLLIVLILLIALLLIVKWASKKTQGINPLSLDTKLKGEIILTLDPHTRVAKISEKDSQWIIVFNQHHITVLPSPSPSPNMIGSES